MAILSCALSGRVPSGFPESGVCSLPAPGAAGRGARLAGLALKLAERVVVGQQTGPEAAVIIGTALGSMTETVGFLESMITEREANPMPRAFAASVHNSVASRVALALGARGACQTFVHGPVSWAHALFAASRVFASGGAGPVIAGGVDEWCDYLARGREASGDALDPTSREGGALWLLARADASAAPLANVRTVRFGRARDPLGWLRSVLAEAPVDFLLVGDTRLGAGPTGGVMSGVISDLEAALTTATRVARPYAPLVGTHPAAGAAALALAAALVGGTCDPAVIETRGAPTSIGVATVSHLGDVAFAALDRTP